MDPRLLLAGMTEGNGWNSGGGEEGGLIMWTGHPSGDFGEKSQSIQRIKTGQGNPGI